MPLAGPLFWPAAGRASHAAKRPAGVVERVNPLPESWWRQELRQRDRLGIGW